MVRPRSGKPCFLALESLERRDCPAVVAVFGGGTIAEGGDSTVLTVRLSAPAAKPVQVGYIIGGDGATPADYRLVIGTRILSAPSGTIEFRPGETEKQVRVSAVDDAAREGNESFRFALFRPAGCTIDAANARADVTVRDNDDYTAAIVPQGPSRVNEGAGAPFVIELTKPATRAETFYVSTQDGTATTADYRPLRDMPVTILAGQQRSQPFSLNTVTDSNNTETDEYFLVTARPRSADMPAIELAGVTIRGTGPAPINVVVTNPSVVEGNTGTSACTFTVTLSAPAFDPIVVQYRTVDGTATGGVDYVAASGSLTFSRGQISKTVTVNVLADTVVEDNETFQLVASVTVGGVVQSGAGVAIVQDDDTSFEIIVRFPDASLTAAQQQVFREAARRWSQIIVGDLPDITLEGRVIDDVEITATAVPIDGAYGVLGQAGPRVIRPGAQGLPATGIMQFDTADVARMVSEGTFTNVILHEMGHVIGIGTLWASFGFVTGFGTADPRYVGSRALAEYQTLVGSGSTPTSVPVENAGGAGSRDAHWRESVFDNELMTSIAERPGVVMPISRLTVASLEDLGYRVNYGAADPYRLPAPLTAAAVATRAANSAAAVTMSLELQRTKPVLRAAVFAAFA